MTESCKQRIQEEWKDRQKDLQDPEFDHLGFDYVDPHTWEDQPEGYWRWQFSWGGPGDELRGYVNENKELHRLEYWFLDWFDGASVQVSPGSDPWNRMQEMLDIERDKVSFVHGYQSALGQ